jgi:amidase
MSGELWRYGAGQLAEMIARTEVSSRSVIEAHLDRIAEVNPALNAIVRVLADEARAAADAADARQRAGEPLGPLHGVPITIKENIDLAGTPTTQGLVPFADAIASVDAPQVERILAAGAIPIGRTNLPDLGLRVHTDSSLHGLTRNPWDATRTAGGSSGGEAAALASGMSPLGFGNDLGGSLRNPAHCCGVASIKPTVGRVPAASSIPPEDPPLMFQLMSVEGVMARHIADVRLGLSLISGAHPRDPLSVTAPFDFARARPTRVSVVPEVPGGATDPAIAATVRRAADHLSDAGYEVVETAPPSYERAIELWGQLLIADVRAQLPLLEHVMGTDGLRFLGFATERFPESDVSSFLAGNIERHSLLRAWSAWMQQHPLLVTPVWTQPPFEHGFDIGSYKQALEVFEIIRPVLPANLLGLPAAVVCGGVVDGLPVGVQITGWRYDEAGCLEAAQAVEAAVGVQTPV